MEKLGIEPMLLVAQVVNFFIIVVLLKKYLYKPILSLLDKRRKEIEEGVALSAKMKEEEEKLRVKEEKAMVKAREEALGIIDSAKKQAKDVEKELVAKAHAQAAAILTRAKDEAGEFKKEAQTSLRREAVELAVRMASRLLATVMTAKAQHTVISAHMKDLEKWAKSEETQS